MEKDECQNCGKKTDGETAFCSDGCMEEAHKQSCVTCKKESLKGYFENGIFFCSLNCLYNPYIKDLQKRRNELNRTISTLKKSTLKT